MSSSRAALWIAALLLCVPLGAQTPPQRPHPAKGLQLETIDWIDDGASFLDRRRFKTSLTKKERKTDRRAILEKALARAREQKRPLLWYVYKVTENTKRGRQLIRAPILDIAMRQIIWSDADVERIVKASFVPLRMVLDESLAKRFGLRPLKFIEPALVFLDPDGQLVHEVHSIRSFDALWFSALLRGVLEKAQGPFRGRTVDEALDRGEWSKALALLKEEGRSPRELYLRATLKRRLRDGEGALKTLAEAQKAWELRAKALAKTSSKRLRRRFLRNLRRGRTRRGASDELNSLAALSSLLRAERGLLLARMGRHSDAVAALQDVADAEEGERRGEAAYLLALLRLRSGDEVGATRRFQKIVQEAPDSRFGRRARANLLLGIDDGRPMGGAFSGLERLAWLPSGAFSSLPQDTTWAGPALPQGEIVERCLHLLLNQQRQDGGWNDSRYSYCPSPRITPNVWVAISALCCQALARNRSRAPADLIPRIDDALRRGERYLLDPTHLNRGRNEDVYADAYRLLYFAQRHRESLDAARRRSLRQAMQDIVRAAVDRQEEGGFWAHEYENAFCTAAMVDALIAVQECGIYVPGTLLNQAENALLSARYKDGSFSYGGRAGKRVRKGNLQNNSTRMPLCEGALFALGASNPKRLEVAFDTFWKFYDHIEGVRKCDFHSDGQIAGFMFFHTLFHTSQTIALLPQSQRAEHHRKLLAKLLSYPELDGTFMDSHELGRSYGTAMALLVIANASKDTTPPQLHSAGHR